jgi:H+/gluconate symporter-like permease
MPRYLFRVLPLALLLALTGAASAQPDIPPPLKDIENGRPWTYQFGKMILAGALAMLVAIVVGYLVKSRDFRANARRGGSK